MRHIAATCIFGLIGLVGWPAFAQYTPSDDAHTNTATPGMKVSWQLTAVRHDPYAEAHPLVVEEDKPAADVGYYEHPELYGQGPEKGVLSRQHSPGRNRSASPSDATTP